MIGDWQEGLGPTPKAEPTPWDRLAQVDPKKHLEYLAFVCRRYGWEGAHAENECRKLTPQGVAYIGVEMRLEGVLKQHREYDPTRDMWAPR